MKELDEMIETQLKTAIKNTNKKFEDFEIDDSFIAIFVKMIGKKREGEAISPETLKNLLDSIKYTKGE